jgi:cell division protein FtsZ
LEASIDGARGVLLSIAGGSDLGLFEISEAAELVAQSAHPDANIIYGTVIDDALGDEVRVTVIAAGFERWEGQDKRSASRVGEPRGGSPRSVFSDRDPLDTSNDDDEFDVPSFLK